MFKDKNNELFYSLGEMNLLLENLEPLKNAIQYINFAASPNPHKGSSGAICPFLPKAIKNNTIWCALLDQKNLDFKSMINIVNNYIDIFPKLIIEDEGLKVYKSLVLIFPNLGLDRSVELIGQIQEEFKERLVKEGLMIGDFYSINNKSGLYNKDFYPLKSNVPMIAIRYLIPEDLPFLINDSYTLDKKIKFLEGYIHSLGDELNAQKLKQAKDILDELKSEIVY